MNPFCSHVTDIAALGCQGWTSGQSRGVGGESRRAKLLAQLLDDGQFETIESARGFTTFTGEMKGVQVSIVATGMVGRERMLRGSAGTGCDPEVVSGMSAGRAQHGLCRAGDESDRGRPMIIIRFGTCGAVRKEIAPGSVVVSGNGSVMITRNPDAFFPDATGEEYYRVSRVMPSSPALSKACWQLVAAMNDKLGALRAEPIIAASIDRDALSVFDGLNATACSFYSSQGRLDPAFDDRNEQLVENLTKTHQDLYTVEMETFHLLDLAQRSRGSIQATAAVLVVANRISGQVVASDVLKRQESFWGQVILETIAATPLQA
ncbi:Nucleoside phosphorylase [Phytophthora cactorum]|nr:Nucleoside phosphorylase [Phytophthora cactorum]